jgi:cell division protease FtsH
MVDFEQAKDKIYLGPERRSMVMTEQERTLTAYHEAGHAVVGKVVKQADPVHKVTIIPRGRALGVTFFLPEKDDLGKTKQQFLSQIAISFGGRVAEDLFLGEVSTGASSDYQNATQIARAMVTQYGMSDTLSPMIYSDNEGEVFLGRSVTRTTTMSEATMERVDAEIHRIVDEQYALAEKILGENRDKVEVMAKALLEWETIDAEQVNDIMEGREPRPPSHAVSSPTRGSSAGGASGPGVKPDSAPAVV